MYKFVFFISTFNMQRKHTHTQTHTHTHIETAGGRTWIVFS